MPFPLVRKAIANGAELPFRATDEEILDQPIARAFKFFTRSVKMNSSLMQIGNVIGDYQSGSGGVSVARRISGMLHLVGDFQGRKYRSGDFDKYNRMIYTVRVGLGFTPGEIPLRIW
jgi:hypothetical protein